MRRIIIIPAVLIGSLIVVWVGTVAAVQLPPQEFPASTITVKADEDLTHQIAQNGLVSYDDDDASTMKGENCSLPISYPAKIRQWCLQIETAAQATGIPARLIAAVMLQESGGDPLAYSSSGAVGLMQVMPRDGLAKKFMCINGPCFASRPTIQELQDPDFNLTYGTQMLAELYQKHTSYREALFRYGPMDVGYDYADLVLNIWDSYR